MEFPSKLPGASLIGEEELAEITDVINSQSPFRFYGIGEPDKVATFELEAKQFLGCDFALAVNSGSSALFCAVAAIGITTGDEVILPAFSWYSDYTSVLLNGAQPVFADIDDTLDLDPLDFEAKITERTKAVIVVHYQGGPANLDEIIRIADNRGISVIEDCAQAFGGEYNGKKLGTIGRVGITSFQGNKMITAGEGGLVYTNDRELFARAVMCHDNGSMRDYFSSQIGDSKYRAPENSVPGFQFRMSELQGAMLLAQLRKLPGLLSTCRRHHQTLRSSLADHGEFELRPFVPGNCGITMFMQFPDAQRAANVSQTLAAEHVPVGPSSGCVNILHDTFVSKKAQLHDSFPPACGESTSPYDVETISSRTDEIIARYIGIGIGPLYTDEHIRFIADGITRALQHESKTS